MENVKKYGLLWFAMFTIVALPFLMPWRIGPQNSWFIESGALFFALLFVLFATWKAPRIRLPATTVFFLILAAFWSIQARVLHLVYPEMSDLTAFIFVCMAMLAWACRLQVIRLGQAAVVEIFAGTLLVGALLQGVVCIIQFVGYSGSLSWVVTTPVYAVVGQLSQRNHLGHFMMWGVLALAYLWSQRRFPNWLGIVMALYLVGIMGLISSRTILIYVAAMMVLVPLLRLWGGAKMQRWAVLTFALAVLVLVAQWAMMPLLSSLFSVQMRGSGLERIVEGGGNAGRLGEWHKAWEVFLAHPVLGVGWQGYAFDGFALVGESQKFRSYETGVLFLHSHNIILNVLAELGLVGTVLVFGGYIAVVFGYLKRSEFNPASALMLVLMGVTLCHSMLEYPLWYVYFLIVFVIMMSLKPYQAPAHIWEQERQPEWLIPVLISVVGLFYIPYYGQAFYQLVQSDNTPKNVEDYTHKVLVLESLQKSKMLPFMRYYVDMALTNQAFSSGQPLPEWGREASIRSSRFRPFINSQLGAYYLEQVGREQEAKVLLGDLAYYYPKTIPQFIEWANRLKQGNSPSTQSLRQICQKYNQQYQEKWDCEKQTSNKNMQK